MVHQIINADVGGIPLWREGKIFGAVGVSGGEVDQDEACARAGVEG